MENTAQFDLNSALRYWLEQLGRSPQVEIENLKELESHVRDSVVQLQTKGLSAEESFIIATHRTGTPAQLEPEYAKVNRSPRNMIIQGLILAFFTLGCWFLWLVLHFPKMMFYARDASHQPGFTRLVVSLLMENSFIYAPPLMAAIYCAYVWTRKSPRGSSWTGLFAVTTATLVLLALVCFVAVFLPVIGYMNQR